MSEPTTSEPAFTGALKAEIHAFATHPDDAALPPADPDPEGA